jgi:hypothetical protein
VTMFLFVLRAHTDGALTLSWSLRSLAQVKDFQ